MGLFGKKPTMDEVSGVVLACFCNKIVFHGSIVFVMWRCAHTMLLAARNTDEPDGAQVEARAEARRATDRALDSRDSGTRAKDRNRNQKAGTFAVRRARFSALCRFRLVARALCGWQALVSAVATQVGPLI